MTAEAAEPEPAQSAVLIDVAAAGLNRADLSMRDGSHATPGALGSAGITALPVRPVPGDRVVLAADPWEDLVVLFGLAVRDLWLFG